MKLGWKVEHAEKGKSSLQGNSISCIQIADPKEHIAG